MNNVGTWSYWDRTFWTKPTDVVIVGAGITGLGAAIAMASARPNLKIKLVDAMNHSRLASTRNAGFACFGSVTEIWSDVQSYGFDHALDLVERRIKGINRIRRLLGDSAVHYVPSGGYELVDSKLWTEDHLDEVIGILSDALADLPGSPIFIKSDQTREAYGFPDRFYLVKNDGEGQLNPAAYVYELMNKARGLGVDIVEGIGVHSWSRSRNQFIVQSDAGTIYTKQLLFTTNAATSVLIPEVDVQPVRNMVLVTEPVDMPFHGVFHLEEGYLYFRDVDQRLLIGGGRHWDKKVEETMDLNQNAYIRERLIKMISEVILPDQRDIRITHEWSGILGMTKDKSPISTRLDSGAYVAAGHSGMGVALALEVGWTIGEQMSKDWVTDEW